MNRLKKEQVAQVLNAAAAEIKALEEKILAATVETMTGRTIKDFETEFPMTGPALIENLRDDIDLTDVFDDVISDLAVIEGDEWDERDAWKSAADDRAYDESRGN